MPTRSARTRASSMPSGMPTTSASTKPVMNSSAESKLADEFAGHDQLPQPHQRLRERHHEGRAGRAPGDLPERDADGKAEPERRSGGWRWASALRTQVSSIREGG